MGYGIKFNRLLCLNNMPVKRYLDNLNSGAVEGLMCRNLFSVGWDGRIFDCDFNQQLDLPIGKKGSPGGLTVFDIDSLESLADTPITVGKHCFGCTAGCGSSCSGSTS